jgi:hypothetical protein
MASIDLFQDWRIANQKATLAAKATLVKSILALDGKGEPPAQAEMDEVRTLRGVADDLFELTIARMADAVAARRMAAKSQTPYDSTWAAPLLS